MSDYIKEFYSAFDLLAPYLKELLGESHIYVVTDGEVFARINADNFPTPLKPGDKVPRADSNYKAFQNNKTIKEIMSKEVFGWDFKSTAIPLRDENNNVVGSIALARSLKRQIKILEIANEIAESISQISVSLSQISAGIQEVAKDSSSALDYVSEVKEENKKADEITQFIKSIAGQTNLLGLNAAIEAARVGEAAKALE